METGIRIFHALCKFKVCDFDFSIKKVLLMASTAVCYRACGGISFYRQSWFGKQQVCSQDGEQPMGNTHCRSAAGRSVPCHGVHPHRNIQIVSISIT